MPKGILDILRVVGWAVLTFFLVVSIITIWLDPSEAADHKAGASRRLGTGFHGSSHGIPVFPKGGSHFIVPPNFRETYPDHIPGGPYPRPNHRTFHPKQAGKLQPIASQSYEGISGQGGLRVRLLSRGNSFTVLILQGSYGPLGAYGAG